MLQPTSPTDPDDAELVAAYTAGHTVDELVAACNLSYRQVHTRLVDAGVIMRPQQRRMRPTPPGLIAAYRSGLSIRPTGRQFGLTYNTTRRMLLDAGIDLRRRGAP